MSSPLPGSQPPGSDAGAGRPRAAGRDDRRAPTPAPSHTSSADERTRIGNTGVDPPTRASGLAESAATPVGPEDAHIEGYQLLEEIHRGGQGVVYRAIQLGTKRQVALKVLLEGPFASDAARRRFEREVELAASLRHPNIVTILDSGVSHGRYYFAMEFIDGLRLDRYLAKVRPSLRETLSLFATICSAINFAHQRGVIHRDLKPPNILVDEDGQPRILDFGLAKPIPRVGSDAPTVQALSTAGELLGTVAYMSPEQTLGAADVDVRSDVYSLGVVFYEALLGQLPYSVDGPLADVLTRIARADPEPPRAVRRRSRFGHLVNDELETILLKTLEKYPARRYQTAGDLARDLRHLLSGEPIEAKRASGLYMLRKTLKRYRVQAGVAATILLTMILSVVALAFLWSSEREASQRAELHRAEALDRALEARRARDAALQSQGQLRRALVNQTIQRGELAQARGDPVGARDFFWDAYEQSDSPATRWALRQYYLQTGDDGASVLTFGTAGATAISPDVKLAAICETSDSITIRGLETGRTVGWLSAPGPVAVMNIDDAGHVAAAGRGWARLWRPRTPAPVVAAELPAEFAAVSAHAVSDGRRLLLVGPQRLLCFEGAAGTAVGNASLLAPRTGLADYSAAGDQVALPTEAGVQLVSVGADGALGSELIGPATVRTRAVHFAGAELLAFSAEGAYVAPAHGAGARPWSRLCSVPRDWELFDVGRDASTLVFGGREGHLSLIRPAKREESWAATLGDLRDLRVTPDGTRVVTLDQRGTLTRWIPAHARPWGREILSQPVSAWAGAEDGSAVLLADDRQRVILYAPQQSPAVETILARRPFSLIPGRGAEDVLMALSANGARGVVCAATSLRLRDFRTRNQLVSTWDDPQFPRLTHAALSGDGEIVAFCSQSPAGDRQQVSFWRWPPQLPPRRNAPLSQLLPPARAPFDLEGSVVRQMAFQPGRTRLLVARSNGHLLWLDPSAERGARDSVTSGLPAPWLRPDSAPVAFAFDRTGRQLAIAGEDATVHLFGSDDAAHRLRIRSDRPIRTLAFDPRGDVLTVCTTDGAVSLYELQTGERVAQLAPPGGGPALATWMGHTDSLLLGTAAGVQEHVYRDTDDLIARSHAYARQRAIARHLANGDLAAAWGTAALLDDNHPDLARSAYEGILAVALRTPGVEIPSGWADMVLRDAPAHTWLQMGHAAYEGERFESALTWLREAVARFDHSVDAYTALRIAQCHYLTGAYDQAAAQYAELLERPDLDPAHVATVQLQQVAALVLAGRRADARAATMRIGAPSRESLRSDVVAVTSARDIARYLTELESESLLGEGLFALGSTLLRQFAEGSLLYHDDGPFFAAEVARQRGDRATAAALYQRCLDVARDVWPSNWARYRLLQLSRGAP